VFAQRNALHDSLIIVSARVWSVFNSRVAIQSIERKRVLNVDTDLSSIPSVGQSVCRSESVLWQNG